METEPETVAEMICHSLSGNRGSDTQRDTASHSQHSIQGVPEMARIEFRRKVVALIEERIAHPDYTTTVSCERNSFASYPSWTISITQLRKKGL